MPRTKTITLYEFDELSDKAKERARDWYRGCRDSNDFEHVIADAVRVLELLGVSLSTHEVRLMGGSTRRDPNIWWQVGYMQSDGAAFEGTYSYAKGVDDKIREYAPQDAELHRIADSLMEIQQRYRYKLVASIRARDMWPQIDIDEPGDMTGDDFKAFSELIKDLNRWIYTQLRAEDEYQSADEQVDENIRANEYTFDAAGNREE